MKKDLVLSLLEKIVIRQFLFVLLSIFLFPSFSNAQGVETVQVGGTTREMLVFASGIDPGRPLMISMHGLNQTMYSQYQTNFSTISAANNFVLVYPQAINNSWQLWGTVDIDFILAIIDKMYNEHGIDRDRVYLHGFSMGGMMTYYAATKIADKIAAFAPVSGYPLGGIAPTNSSRPIPIIHAHGIDDGYVPYNNVQTSCLDPWIARNGCPSTPQITDPYPADNSSPGSSKKYWGPGTYGVEVVFLSLAGVGHWYSNSPINTSQEVWDFCNKYSLKFGSEFQYASVTDSDPKQIKLIMTSPIADSSYFNGFTVKVDNVIVPIDSIVLMDTTQLGVYLSDSILNTNEITISYNNGNLFSSVGKAVTAFGDTLVDNLLKGASPRLLEVTTNKTGDTLIVRFNKKMLIPLDISTLTLNADYNGQVNVSILQTSFYNNDSTALAFSLDTKLYRDYELSFTYSGSNIASADSGMLKPFTDLPVTNIADGLPVQIVSGNLASDGLTLSLVFQKPMALTGTQSSSLILKVNGIRVYFSSSSAINDTIQIILSNNLYYGDIVTVSYTPGTIKARDNGPLAAFSNLAVTNQISAPTWIQIPGKVEAENFAFKSGMQTEATGDVGGGLNLGYITDGNWVEYTIENNTSKTEFQIAFRLASPSTTGKITYYLDYFNFPVDIVSCPNTGGFQVYQSVIKNITISQGKHYLKIVATSGDFNINYMDITEIPAPVAQTIVGSDTVSASARKVTYSIPYNQGSTYAWSVPAGATIASGQGTNSIKVNFGTSGGTVQVTETNASGNASSSLAVFVPATPVIQSVAGPVYISSNAQGITYSIPSVNPASTYVWSVPAGATIVSGQGTNSIKVNFGTSGGTVQVTETNASGNASSSLAVSVPSTPVIQSVAGPVNVSPNAQGITYSIPSNPASTYNWIVPAGATIVSGQGTNAITVNFGSSGGTVQVTETNASGNASSSVTVNADLTAIHSYASSSMDIQVYPNPFSEETSLTFNSSSSMKINLKVIDMLGGVIYESDDYTTNEKIILNRELSASGIYMILAIYDNKIQVVKVEKK
jgi:poly(3-hydroxybutyrate) depolymerase